MMIGFENPRAVWGGKHVNQINKRAIMQILNSVHRQEQTLFSAQIIPTVLVAYDRESEQLAASYPQRYSSSLKIVETLAIALTLCSLTFWLSTHFRQRIQSEKTRQNQFLMDLQCISIHFCSMSRIYACTKISTILKSHSSLSQSQSESCSAIIQTILHGLYDRPEKLRERQRFHEIRIKFVQAHSEMPNLYLAKYNLVTNHTNFTQKYTELENDFQRLDRKFNLSEIQTQLPLCVGISGRDNNDNFRIESNLNSVLEQNYSNFKIVLIDDFSQDGTVKQIQNYINFYGLEEPFFTFIRNQEKKTSLENYQNIFGYYCDEDSIAVAIDGDDQIMGKNVFKVFNSVYQRKRAGFVYSNYIYFNQFSEQIGRGDNHNYTELEKAQLKYREVDKFSHIRTFQISLFREINERDLRDESGDFFVAVQDKLIALPIMEMSCQRVFFVDEFQLVYNTWRKKNVGIRNQTEQIEIYKKLQKKAKYSCSSKFMIKVANDTYWS